MPPLSNSTDIEGRRSTLPDREGLHPDSVSAVGSADRSGRPAYTGITPHARCATRVTVETHNRRSEVGCGGLLKITQIYEGTNQVQRVVMARQLLAGVQSKL